MKAISLWHRERRLLPRRSKDNRARADGQAKYRGPLVLREAKCGLSIAELIQLLCMKAIDSGLAPLVGEPLGTYTGGKVKIKHLPFGKVVAVVNLVDCRETDDLSCGVVWPGMPYGDFTPGRYAWILDHVRRITEPFPVIGRQGLFEVDIMEGSVL